MTISAATSRTERFRRSTCGEGGVARGSVGMLGLSAAARSYG